MKKDSKTHKPMKEMKKVQKSQDYNSDSASDDSVGVSEEPEMDYSLDTLDANDFALVEFSTKKTKIHYVARIEKVESGGATVKFMRKQSNETFIFPEIDGISMVDTDDIILKLTQPSISGCTFRAASSFCFEIKLHQYNIR